MIICGTGHRPADLPWKYDEKHTDFLAFYRKLNKWLEDNTPDIVISGGALGFDTWLAEAALNLKFDVHLYMPCENQEKKWPISSQKRYQRMKEKCGRVFLVNKEYSAANMQKRNEAMVNSSDLVLALWKPSKTYGGTYNCIKYAEKQGKRIENLWPL